MAPNRLGPLRHASQHPELGENGLCSSAFLSFSCVCKGPEFPHVQTSSSDSQLGLIQST